MPEDESLMGDLRYGVMVMMMVMCSNFRCRDRGCPCRKFFFHVTVGAWQIRCECKHKAIEHRPTPPWGCGRPGCTCTKFFSPWVCNCDHGWDKHVMVSEAIHASDALEYMNVPNVDMVARGHDVQQ